MRPATLLDRAVAVMVLMGWCAWLWQFYSANRKVTEGDTMAKKRKKNPPREPVIEDELALVIERAAAGKFDLTDAQIKALVKELSSYVDQVAEESYDAGYEHAKEAEE